MLFKNKKQKFLSLKEAAEILNYAPDYIGFLIRKGQIPGKKIYSRVMWQVSQQAILDYLDRKGQKIRQANDWLNLIKNQKYISLKDAAKITGYHSDYVGWLIRNGKIPGKKIYSGVCWSVSEDSIENFLLKRNEKKISNLPLTHFWRKGFSFYLKAPKYGIIFSILGFIIFSGLIAWAISPKNPIQTATIYSTQSVGDWQNPQNVILAPEVPENGDFDVFSDANSAVYKSGTLSLVVENFQKTESEKIQNEVTSTTPTEVASTTPNLEEINPFETTTTGPISFLRNPGRILSASYGAWAKNLFAKMFVRAQEVPTFEELVEKEFVSAKIKFSFAIGEKKLDLQPIEQTATSTELKNNNTSTEESISFWTKIKNFFASLFNKVALIAKAEETTTTIVTDETTATLDEIFENQLQFGETTTTNENITSTEMVSTTTEVFSPTATSSIGEEEVVTEATTTEATTTETATTTLETATTTLEIATTSESLPNLDAKIIIWWSLDGQNWQILETISSYSASNFLNGGYFSYDAPFLKNWDDVRNLKIKFEGAVGGETIVTAYLDSVWLEVEFREKEKEGEKIEFISSKKDFQATEEPEFQFRYQKSNRKILASVKENLGILDYWQNIKVNTEIKNLKGEIIDILPDFFFKNNGEFSVKIKKPQVLNPGLYKIILRIEEEEIDAKQNTKLQETIFEQDFSWGVLAINTNKSIYLPNETAYLQMAALTSNGHTICNANLILKIKNQKSKIETELSTKEGTIQYSGECGPDNVTNKPDYFTYYQVGEVGNYEMKLTNLDAGYEITDSFEVKESVPFEVERIGPTRIYPPATYEMILKIKVNQDFQGQVIEKVPASFEVINPLTATNTEPIAANIGVNSWDTITTEGDTKQIIWQVTWKTGEVYELRYQFDAPDITPYLHLIGPLRFYE